MAKVYRHECDSRCMKQPTKSHLRINLAHDQRSPFAVVSEGSFAMVRVQELNSNIFSLLML